MQTFRIKLRTRITLIVGVLFFTFVVANLYGHTPMIGWAFLLLFLILFLVYTFILWSYKVVIDGNGTIREIYWVKTGREVKVQNISKIEKTVAGFFPRNIPVPSPQSFRFNLVGSFTYKQPFPFYQVDFNFLDALIKLNPNIQVDSYFSSWLSKETRQKENIQLSWSDKIANVIGYILYGILYVIVSSIALVIIGALLIGLYRLITGQINF